MLNQKDNNSNIKYILTGLLSTISFPCFAEPPGFYWSFLAVIVVIILIVTLILGYFLNYVFYKFDVNLPVWAIYLIAFVISALLSIILF